MEYPNNLITPERAAQESRAELFDIEKYGDPRISWWMYYVTKTEAYYRLQPDYLATDNYPFRVESENVVM
jgi:hypothetical protein